MYFLSNVFNQSKYNWGGAFGRVKHALGGVAETWRPLANSVWIDSLFFQILIRAFAYFLPLKVAFFTRVRFNARPPPSIRTLCYSLLRKFWKSKTIFALKINVHFSPTTVILAEFWQISLLFR